MSILVLNTGSSSLKFGLFDTDSSDTLASGMIDWAGEAQRANLVLRARSADEIRRQLDVTDHRSAVTHALRAMVETGLLPTNPAEQIRIVGHRVVHGGTMFRDSVRVDENVTTAIAQLADLAPLHNPPALEAIEAAQAALPGVPNVTVFDTAFFANLPASAYVYPLPYEWYSEWGVRRFGFHGISHAYCAGRAAELLARDPAKLRLIICHLGNGCSASAVRGGIAVATTMGFTPLDGLMMGTRPGSVDPGILVYLQRQRGLTAEQLDRALNHASGLFGVSGVSSDFRQVEAAARQGNERARLALEVYAARVRAAIGSLAVT
ncbi:MAG: acetate/propionate family kinase, partial [Candidatus Omnitrophica bacterium]|nr:acetate/propionate family kinase [Candidatus Omnitrophota bacterium]